LVLSLGSYYWNILVFNFSKKVGNPNCLLLSFKGLSLMREVYGVLVNIIIYSACLNFYARMGDEKLVKAKARIIVMSSVIYRLLLFGFIEPMIQIVTSFIVVGGLLWVLEKKITWIILLVSFLMTYILQLFATLSSMILAFLILTSLRVERPLNTTAEIFTLVLTSTVIFLVLYSVVRLDKNRKINLFMFAQYLKSNLVQGIVFAVGLLIALVYIFVFTDLGIYITNELAFVFWFVTTLLVLIIITLTIFIVRHLISERKKQQQLEAENERLAIQHNAINSQLSKLKTVHTDLKGEFDDVVSNYHAYKYVVPVLMDMQESFISELDSFSDYSYDEKLNRIRSYADQIRVLTFQINDGLGDDFIQSELEYLNIPTNWQVLSSLLKKLMQTALAKGVYLSVQNCIQSWEKFNNVPQVVFVRLLSNIADNAIKESCKIDVDKRGDVRIALLEDEEGYLCFEVQDAAAEFDISILKELGARKNSTNGTGDGYAEIMQDLCDVKASLVIKEWKKRYSQGKQVMIMFDSYNMRLIDSHYRYLILKDELAGTELEIMDVH